MNINQSPQTPQFNGYLKLQGGRYINSKQITSVIYDYPDIYRAAKADTLSSAFAMTDGMIYGIQYLTKPIRSLIDNILIANKNDNTIVDVDAMLTTINKSVDDKQQALNAQNKDLLDSFQKYLKMTK